MTNPRQKKSLIVMASMGILSINALILSTMFVMSMVLFSANRAMARTQVDEYGNTIDDEESAEKYFRHDRQAKQEIKAADNPGDDSDTVNSSGNESRDPAGGPSSDHYLALHLGAFMSNDAYQWGGVAHGSNVGRLNLGVSYRVSSIGSFGDWLLRADYQAFEFPDGKPSQIVFSPMFTFPDSKSGFPLYFGATAGLGIFVQQIDGGSPLSFDYSLLAGARVFNLINETGFFIEGGLKNFILLTSQGQFNGFFLAAGAIFTF